jgi:hypothetical protein
MTSSLSPRFRVFPLWACFLVVAGLASGCMKAQAKTSPDGPPLDVPAPPARVIAPVEEPLAATPAEPLEPAPAPPSTTRRPVRRAPTNAEQTQKPDQPTVPSEAPLPQAAQPEPPITNNTPLPTLRAPGSAERPIRDRVTSAQRDLSKVDYAKLTEDGRAQYDQSKRFIQQAEQALKEQNFVFAQTLADKAATLAAELLGR